MRREYEKENEEEKENEKDESQDLEEGRIRRLQDQLQGLQRTLGEYLRHAPTGSFGDDQEAVAVCEEEEAVSLLIEL